MSAVMQFLRSQPVVVLFLLLGAGYLLGRVRIAGVALGSISATLLVSIVLGHFGVRMSSGAQSVGFALFIFSVGYQAGPRFLEVIRTQGLRYLLLALFVALVGVGLSWIAGRLLELPAGGTAGLLAGALTSTPTLAAAQEAVRSGLVSLPAGASAEQTIAWIGTAYAITYLVGTVGPVLAITLVPRVLGINLAAAARALERTGSEEAPEALQARAYRVESEEFCSTPLRELAARYWQGRAVVRVRRTAEWLRQGDDARLLPGDEIYAFGHADLFRGGLERAGPEIAVRTDLEFSPVQSQVIISAAAAVGHTLCSLNLAQRFMVVVLGVRRDGRAIPVAPQLILQSQDVLTIIAPGSVMKELSLVLGPVEVASTETDMTTFVFGIAAGAALGLLSVTIRGVPLTLGMAGGLMLSGLAVGWFHGVRPTVGRFPEAARWVLMEFGLLIFIAGAGLSAGRGFLQAFRATGVPLVVAALPILLLSLVLGYLFGRKVLKIEPVILLGALTGAMTATPALQLLEQETKSTVPALGYASTYAFASILLTLAGTLMMAL
jgi:putative transport protein